MTEQEVRSGVGTLRFTVSEGPKDLDSFLHFFESLSSMYGAAVALYRLDELAESGETLDDSTVGKMFRVGRLAEAPGIENVSMRSPLAFDLTSVTQVGTCALSFLYLLLKAPEKLARLPSLHAQWHGGRLQKEILKAQRAELQRRLKAGEIDVLALDLGTAVGDE